MDNTKSTLLQRFLDNIWLLFILGVVIFFASYIFWGIYQVGQVPPMPAEFKQNLK
ncbi:MAG: hypothetical protein ACK40G_10630 [Cytophagaceae bacterium]